VLNKIGLWSEEAEELVFLTGLTESKYHYIRQLKNGPAMSVFQVEPSSGVDICLNYLRYRKTLLANIASSVYVDKEYLLNPSEERMRNMLWMNQGLAIVMCRLTYRRSPLPLPKVGDLDGMAKIWKKVYNTHLGKGTVQHFKKASKLRQD
jgi:hypothetical protein